jgi:hypothetical protein
VVECNITMILGITFARLAYNNTNILYSEFQLQYTKGKVAIIMFVECATYIIRKTQSQVSKIMTILTRKRTVIVFHMHQILKYIE